MQHDDTDHGDMGDQDATEEQLATLRSLGVPPAQLDGLAWRDAEQWIDELRSRAGDRGVNPLKTPPPR